MSENQPVILNEKGKPFSSEEAAQRELKDRSLDAKKWSVRRWRGGWAIVDMDVAVALATGTADGPEGPKAPEKYWLVEFSQTSNPYDLPHVPLILKTRQLNVRRGVPVVLPESYVEIARNATLPNWKPNPEDPKKPLRQEGVLHRYPFRVIREATREEFMEGLASGNRIQSDYLERMRQASG